MLHSIVGTREKHEESDLLYEFGIMDLDVIFESQIARVMLFTENPIVQPSVSSSCFVMSFLFTVTKVRASPPMYKA